MQLLLIRHATAEDHGHPQGDSARALVEKGRRQSQRVGAFLKKHDLIPDLVLTSPVLRAQETADLLVQEGCPPPITEAWLSCGMHPEEALRELAAYRQTTETIAIVGHEPDFSELVAHILGQEKGHTKVKKASLISLTIHPPLPGGILNFSIPCKFL